MVVGDILDQGLRSISYFWGYINDNDGSEEVTNTLVSMYSREHIMILFLALVMFPLSLQKNVESLEWASSLGVLSNGRGDSLNFSWRCNLA